VVSVTLPPGLSAIAGTPLTFGVGSLAPGATATLTVRATANTVGAQTITATVSSPDANSATAMGSVTVLTAQERLVQALYLADLARTGSLAELDAWVAILNGPGGSRAVVAADIAGSTEARDDLVKSWYQKYLGRLPGNSEEMGWVNMLTNQTQEMVLGQILGGTEFFNRAQTLVNTGTPPQRFVQALYPLLLGRTAGPTEIAGWTNLLPTIGQRGVATAILQSGEYRGIVISGYYNTLLHRSPDLVGLNGWVLSNIDLGMVRGDFAASQEFFTNG
jgi:hypothetical protein